MYSAYGSDSVITLGQIILCLVKDDLFDVWLWQVLSLSLSSWCPLLRQPLHNNASLSLVLCLWLALLLTALFFTIINRLQTCLPRGSDRGVHLCACVSAWCLWEGECFIALVSAKAQLMWASLHCGGKQKKCVFPQHIDPLKLCSFNLLSL